MISRTLRLWDRFERDFVAAMRSPSLANHQRAMRSVRTLEEMGYPLDTIQRRGRRAYFLAMRRGAR